MTHAVKNPTYTLRIVALFGVLMIVGVALQFYLPLPRVGHFIYNFAFGSLFPASILFATGRQSRKGWRITADSMAVAVLAWMAFRAYLTVDPDPEFFEDVGVMVHSVFLAIPALLFALVATAFGRSAKNA